MQPLSSGRRKLVFWNLIFLAITTWAVSLRGFALGGLDLGNGPFMLVPMTFWAAYGLLLCAAFLCRAQGEALAAGLLALTLTVGTLVLIEPYGRMHDSFTNADLASNLPDAGAIVGSAPYLQSYPLFFYLFGSEIQLLGADYYTASKLFAIGLGFFYVFIFAGLTGRVIASRATHSGQAIAVGLVSLFAFGPLLDLRLNPAPVSFAFSLSLVFLYAFLRSGQKWNALTILLGLAVVVSHPLSPIFLVLPLAYMVLSGSHNIRRYLRIATVMLISTLAWVLYNAGFVLDSVRTLLAAFSGYEGPGAPFAPPLPSLHPFVDANRIALVSFGLLTLAFLWAFRRSREARGFVLTILFGAPIIGVFLTSTFFSRLTLFLIPLFVLAFGSSVSRASAERWSERLGPDLANVNTSLGRGAKLRAAFVGLCLVVAPVAAYVAYWTDNAFDRPTASEVQSQIFIANHLVGGALDLGGFDLPLHFQTRILQSERGVVNASLALSSGRLLVTQQMVQATIVRERVAYAETKLGALEFEFQQVGDKVYDSGMARLYLMQSGKGSP